MEKTAVCIGLTHDFEFAAGVVLLNFIDLHGSSNFDFKIYSDKDLPRLKRIMLSQGVGVEVIKYRPPYRGSLCSLLGPLATSLQWY